MPITASLLLLCPHHSIIITAMPSQQYNYYHIVPITAPLLILLSSPSPLYQSKDNPSSIIPTVPSSHHCHHCASHGTSLTTVPSSHHCHHCASHIISLTTVPSSHHCPHCVSHIISITTVPSSHHCHHCASHSTSLCHHHKYHTHNIQRDEETGHSTVLG